MDGTRILRGLHPDGIVHVLGVLRPHREFATGNPHHALRHGFEQTCRVFQGRQEGARRMRHRQIRGGRRGWLDRSMPRANHQEPGCQGSGDEDEDDLIGAALAISGALVIIGFAVRVR